MKNAAINKIDENVWECNGLWIEYGFYGDNEYSVQFCGDDIIFDTFAQAVRFCREYNTPAREEEDPAIFDWRGYGEEPEDMPDPEFYPV